MKISYFEQEKADEDDYMLQMCIAQGYVPATCLLGGNVVYSEVNRGNNPCWGCNGDRARCKGKPKSNERR